MPIKMVIEPSRKLNMTMKLLYDRTSPEYLEEGAMAGCRIIAAGARDIVPIDTGDLQSTIRVVPGRRTEKTSSAMVTAGGKARSGADVNYAGFVEFGTSRMAAQPYLRPAYDQFKEKAIQETGDALLTTIFDPRTGSRNTGFSFGPTKSPDFEPPSMKNKR